jgi:hypothetical protein
MTKAMTEMTVVELTGGETMSIGWPKPVTSPPGASEGSGIRGSRHREISYTRSPMERALVDRYRCQESVANFELTNQLSSDTGYFRFGEATICYGRSASGFREKSNDSILYDAFADARVEGSTVWLPFNPSDIIDNLRLERYANEFDSHTLSRWTQSLRNAYYFLRPMMGVGLRRHVQRVNLSGWRNLSFPRWPVDTTVEDLCEQLLLLSMKAQGIDRLPFIWFWPDGAQSCVAMTHDVETEKGRAFCTELMDMDDALGIRASIQVVPEGSYEVSSSFIQEIRDRGFEVNIQDLNHDGHLYRSREEFLRRVRKINQYGKDYKARGFRAAVLYRNLDWYGGLDFSFDMSVPNVGHLDPQRGGCCTVMPYFVGDILEIPVTTTQDYMLFHLLNDYSLDLWRAQTEIIMEKNGLVSFVVHPDYVVEEKARASYRDLLSFLEQLSRRKRIWFAVAGEIDQWWRMRSQMRLVQDDGKWQIEGAGAERAKLAFATAKDGHLRYDVEG